ALPCEPLLPQLRIATLQSSLVPAAPGGDPCGARNAPAQKFCGECGGDFERIGLCHPFAFFFCGSVLPPVWFLGGQSAPPPSPAPLLPSRPPSPPPPTLT